MIILGLSARSADGRTLVHASVDLPVARSAKVLARRRYDHAVRNALQALFGYPAPAGVLDRQQSRGLRMLLLDGQQQDSRVDASRENDDNQSSSIR